METAPAPTTTPLPAPPALEADAAPAPEKPNRTLLSAAWGSGPGQLGHVRPHEANPEGPKSFALTAEGFAVLDQVNERVVRFDARGNPLGSVRVPATTDDLAVTKDGSMALLDRLVGKSVRVLDPQGRPLAEYSLEAAGIRTPGTTSGVFVEGDQVYVERNHGALVPLGTLDGRPPGGNELSGRPSKDGALLVSAGEIAAPRGQIYLNVFERAKQSLLFTRKIGLGAPVHQLVLLDTDARGTVYVGAWIVRAGEGDAVLVSCFASSDGRDLGQALLRVNEAPEESFRDFAVDADGTIVYALRGEHGVDYLRATCPLT